MNSFLLLGNNKIYMAELVYERLVVKQTGFLSNSIIRYTMQKTSKWYPRINKGNINHKNIIR